MAAGFGEGGGGARTAALRRGVAGGRSYLAVAFARTPHGETTAEAVDAGAGQAIASRRATRHPGGEGTPSDRTQDSRRRATRHG